MQIYASYSEKTVLMKTLEKLQFELTNMKSKYDELKRSKQEAILEVSKGCSWHCITHLMLCMDDFIK